jgi:transcriptional regulator of NAD metabolism
MQKTAKIIVNNFSILRDVLMAIIVRKQQKSRHCDIAALIA